MSQFLKKPIIRDGVPKDTEGYEGEIRFGFHKGKLKQFVRLKNKWHSITFGVQVVSATEAEETTALVGKSSTSTLVSSGTFTSLSVGNLTVTGNFIGSDGTLISSASIATHPNSTSQAHPDYLKNTGADILEGTLEITGRNSGGATSEYTLKITDSTSPTQPVLYTSNREHTDVKKAGFWISGGSIAGIFDVGTASNANFSISDSGVVSGYQLDFTNTVDAAGGFSVNGTAAIDGSGHYIGGGDIVVDSINTNSLGANLVYPLVLGADADDNSVEYVSGSAQGNAVYKFKVGADSITDTHLEHKTGQNLRASDRPEFDGLSIGPATPYTGILTIKAAIPTVKLVDASSTAYFSNSAGKILFGSTAGAMSLDNLPFGSETFTSGFTGGAGWEVTNLGSDKYRLELDELSVRGTMNVHELLINQIRATNGSLIVSDAAKIAVQAQDGVNDWGIFTITSDDATDLHPFSNNDILLFEWTDFDGTDNKYYLAVTDISQGTNNQFKATVYNSSGIAISGSWTFDLVNRTGVRIGNATDASRQGGLYLSSVDSGAPFLDIWNNVDSIADWTGNGKLKVRLGNLEGISYASASIPANTYGLWAEDVYLKGKIHAEEGYIGDSTNGWAISSDKISNSNISIEAQSQIINIGTLPDFDITGSAVGIRMGSDGGGNYDFLVGAEAGDYLHYDGSSGTVTLRGSLVMPSGNSPVDWLGTWNSGTTYSINDAVFRNSNSYVSIKDSPANTNKDPETQTTYWDLLAAQGDDGSTGGTGGDGDDADIYKSFTIFKNGASAPTVDTNGSVNNTSDVMTAPATWSLTPSDPSASNFIYASTSTWKQINGGTNTWNIEGTWASVVQWSGDTGDTGGDGDNYKQFTVFRNAAISAIAGTPSGGTVDSSGVMIEPSNWVLIPTTPSAGQYTFFSVSTWKQTGGADPFDIDTAWTYASQLSGETGETGNTVTPIWNYKYNDGYLTSGQNLPGKIMFSFGDGIRYSITGVNSLKVKVVDDDGNDQSSLFAALKTYLDSGETQHSNLSTDDGTITVGFRMVSCDSVDTGANDTVYKFGIDSIVWSGASTFTGLEDVNFNLHVPTPGVDGIDGSAGIGGVDGTSIALLFLYQRLSYTPVITDLNTSEFDFSTNTINNMGSNWSTTIPASDGNPCWVTTSPATTTDIAVPDTSLTWEAPSILSQDGGDGLPGPKLVYAYRLMSQVTADSLNTNLITFSGSYASPVAPSNWSLTIPTLVTDFNIYVTLGTYNQDSAGATVITNSLEFSQWSGVQGTDGTSVNIIDSVANSSSLPGYPSSYTGDIGDAYITLDSGHLWIWDGNSWNDAGNITGPSGPQGNDGTPGAEGEPGNVYSTYHLYSNDSTTPADVDPDDVAINISGVVTATPLGWSSIPTNPGDGESIYISQAVYVQINTVGNIGTNAYTIFGAWSSPAQFSGNAGLSASWLYEHDGGGVLFSLGSGGDGQIGFKKNANNNTAPEAEANGEWLSSWHEDINQVVISRFDENGYDHEAFFTTECAIGTILAYTHGATGETYRFKINSSHNREAGAGNNDHGDIFSFLIEDVGDTYGEQGTSNVAGQFYPIASLDGVDGTDGLQGTAGADGETIVLVYAYRRSGTTLADGDRPTSQTYTFTTGQLSGLDNSWTDTIPAADGNPCYVVTGTARTDDINTPDTSWTWSTPQIVFQDGGDGAPGEKTVFAYKNLTLSEFTAPEAVPTFAGTYSSPTVDNSWQFAPSAPSSTELIYTVVAKYNVDTGGDTVITPPVAIVQFSGQSGADGMGIDLQGTVATVGALPGGGNTAGDAYIVTADGHIYIWDGDSWEDGGQFTGDQGPSGPAGGDGDTYKTFTVYRNVASSTAGAADTPSNSGVVVSSAAEMTTTPNLWTIAAVTPNQGEFTFYSTSVWKNTNQASPNWTIDTTWTLGALLSGFAGSDGVQGNNLVFNVNNWNGSIDYPANSVQAKIQIQVDKTLNKVTITTVSQTLTHNEELYLEIIHPTAEILEITATSGMTTMYPADGTDNSYAVPFPEDGAYTGIHNTSSGWNWGKKGVWLKRTIDTASAISLTAKLDTSTYDIIDNVQMKLYVRFFNQSGDYAHPPTTDIPTKFIAFGDRRVLGPFGINQQFIFSPTDTADFDVTLMNNSPVNSSTAASNMASFSNPSPDIAGLYLTSSNLGYVADIDNDMTWTTYMDNTGRFELLGNPITDSIGAGLVWNPGNGTTVNPSLTIQGDLKINSSSSVYGQINHGMCMSSPSSTTSSFDVVSYKNISWLSEVLYTADAVTGNADGLTLLVIDITSAVALHLETLDVCDAVQGASRRTRLANLLTGVDTLDNGALLNIPSQYIIIIVAGTTTTGNDKVKFQASPDDENDTEGLVAALEQCGATNPRLLPDESSGAYNREGMGYCLVGKPQIGRGNGFEVKKASVAYAPPALLPFTVMGYDINSGLTSGGTEISGDSITTGIIKSNNINEAVVDTNFITQGTNIDLYTGEIKSENFAITSAGSAYFKGDISATSGIISGNITLGEASPGSDKIVIGNVASNGSLYSSIEGHDLSWLSSNVQGISYASEGSAAYNYWVMGDGNWSGLVTDDYDVAFRVGTEGQYIEFLAPMGPSGIDDSYATLKIAAATIELTSGETLTGADSIVTAINATTDGVFISGDNIEINGSTVFTNVSNWEDPWSTVWSFTSLAEIGSNWSTNGDDDIMDEFYISGGLAGKIVPEIVADAGAQGGVAYRFGDGDNTTQVVALDCGGSSANDAVSGTVKWRRQRILIDENKLYKVSARVKAYKSIDGGTANGDQSIDFGYMGFTSNNNAYLNYGTGGTSFNYDQYHQLYGAHDLLVDENWTTITFYIRGKSATPTVNSIYNEVSAPGNFGDDQYYFCPMLICKGSSVPDWRPDILIDWIKVEAQGGTSQTLIDGGNIVTGSIHADYMDVDSIFTSNATLTGDLTLGTNSAIHTFNKNSAIDTTDGIFLDKEQFALGTINSTGMSGEGIQFISTGGAYDGFRMKTGNATDIFVGSDIGDAGLNEYEGVMIGDWADQRYSAPASSGILIKHGYKAWTRMGANGLFTATGSADRHEYHYPVHLYTGYHWGWWTLAGGSGDEIYSANTLPVISGTATDCFFPYETRGPKIGAFLCNDAYAGYNGVVPAGKMLLVEFEIMASDQLDSSSGFTYPHVKHLSPATYEYLNIYYGYYKYNYLQVGGAWDGGISTVEQDFISLNDAAEMSKNFINGGNYFINVLPEGTVGLAQMFLHSYQGDYQFSEIGYKNVVKVSIFETMQDDSLSPSGPGY